MPHNSDDGASRRDFLSWTTATTAIAAITAGAAPATARRQQEELDVAAEEVPDDVSVPPDEITDRTVAEASKLAVLELTPDERRQVVESIEEQLEIQRRRVAHGELPDDLAPATVFDPRLPGHRFDQAQEPIRYERPDPGPLPDSDEDIAFAPVVALSHWLERGAITSVRLTEIYLDRLERIGGELEAVITMTEDLALSQARRADAELAAGRRRGPLHGIPWGAKDLLDTESIATTWGATPYRDRVAKRDAAVVTRLREAGAVLVAKLTLGALAYNDIWFDGRTRNPWNTEQGSSGSSAGSAACTAAGLVGFSLGTETLGSIVSPCMRCGTTGLRPTFGRVGRSGAMALCWSLDKIGPICRTVEDCAIVLEAINGHDPDDPSSIEMPFNFDATQSIRGLRVGYVPSWFEGEGANDLDRAVLEMLPDLGCRPTTIELPKLPYGALMTILMAEATAAFEHLTRSNRDDELRWQVPRAWPNSFRRSWFVPAPELVQSQRLRRAVMQMMAEQFERVDVMIGPSYAGAMLLITNNTGHPSLTLRSGFKPDGMPHGTTIWGRLFDEGTICRLGMAIEQKLGVWDRRPAL